MTEIDFAKIAARGGSVESAFEELCCQLAARTRAPGTNFERYRGDGGDGGVECRIIEPSGCSIGWQSKFVFDIDGLIKQADKSLQTALSVYPDLTHYVVCFPFDLTGKTARKGKSQSEKFDEWVRRAKDNAKAVGRALTIEYKSAHHIINLLLEQDPSGGLRHYFFSATSLSHQWFEQHVANARCAAGPRYNREINLETSLAKWFASFAGGIDWQTQLANYLDACRKQVTHTGKLAETKSGNPMQLEWPVAIHQKVKNLVTDFQICIQSAEKLKVNPTEEALSSLQELLSRLLDDLTAIEHELAADLDAAHGEGSADSKKFRSYMAEYQVSFPAANLNAVRELRESWQVFFEWLSSPAGFLAFRRVFVLSGIGGAGKTHSICDIAQRRLAAGAYTCVVFGHQFGGEPDPWSRFAESLGLPLTLGRNGILDALSAAAECSGEKLVICLDAVNETRPRSYWFDRFDEFASVVASRPHLKLCVSCRTSFLPACLPRVFADQEIEHKGFAGMERDACNAFFYHYRLEAPLVPVLQPELANPLYLKLVCQTLSAKGLKQLPKGWFGMAPVIRAFLKHKEEQFEREHSVSTGAAIVSGSLQAISAAIAKAGSAALPWSEAQSAIDAAKPHAKAINVLQWLVTADLLIEDGPFTDAIGAENLVRPAFERFGDFLVASKMLDSIAGADIEQAFWSGGKFNYLLCSTDVISANSGLLSALSVLLPEKICGMELTDLVDEDQIKSEVAKIVVRSLPWRTATTFLASTQQVLRSVLNSPGAYEAMDAILAASTQESQIDAFWLHEVLQWLPFPKRDAFWCDYFKLGWENNNIVRRIIEAATDMDVRKVDYSTAERWCVVLLWFTAAADRRVKDFATRSAVGILRHHPSLLPKLVDLFLATDDDELRERVLLIAYGALIYSREKTILSKISSKLLNTYMNNPSDFENAIIRDHIRCIAELASYLGCLDNGLDPTITNQRNSRTSKPEPPADAEKVTRENEQEYGAKLVIQSCIHNDFNHYSINCLREWHDAMPKPAIGEWIARRVLDDFGYRNSGCSEYDSTVTSENGGGRGKPKWSERIGKKYQWIAMYQLASRLYDNVDRKKDPRARTTDRLPLILQEERKLDPTIIYPERHDRKPSECWWIGSNVDLHSTEKLDYATWINLRNDLPSMEALLAPKNNDGQRWLPLICYPSWSDRKERLYNEPYRSTWVSLRAFLVPEAQFKKATKAISRRNFFGDWMPNNAKWLYSFVGEYPWATACNVETDDWLGFDTKVSGSDLEFIPVFNEIVCEWEYDGSLPPSIYFHVPARAFFKAGPLWWNGVDGFSNAEGKTVFRDPSASEGGPATLLADLDDLLPRLEKLGFRIVWTLLGEKYVLGDQARNTPQVTYSQTAYLNKDGSITVGDRVFFENYEEDQGLGA